MTAPVGPKGIGLMAWLVLGCGPVSGTDETGSSGPASTGPGASTGASSAVDSASGSTQGSSTIGTTEATSTGITTLDTGVEDTAGTGESLCPAPEEAQADFTVTPDLDISSACTVTSVEVVDEADVIELDCQGEAVTLSLTAAPTMVTPWVFEGDPVHLTYITEPIFWINRWFALHSAIGETDWLLAGGVSSSALDPPNTTLEALFAGGDGDPLVSVVEGECGPSEGRCGQAERLAIDLSTAEGSTLRVFDQGTGFIDLLAYGYRLTVERAIHNLRPIRCDDLPARWYQLMVAFFPSD